METTFSKRARLDSHASCRRGREYPEAERPRCGTRTASPTRLQRFSTSTARSQSPTGTYRRRRTRCIGYRGSASRHASRTYRAAAARTRAVTLTSSRTLHGPCMGPCSRHGHASLHHHCTITALHLYLYASCTDQRLFARCSHTCVVLTTHATHTHAPPRICPCTVHGAARSVATVRVVVAAGGRH